MSRLILLAAVGLFAASPAAAQLRTDARFATAPRAELAPSTDARGDTSPEAPGATARREHRGAHVAGRSAFGALGWFGGAAVGGLLGLALVSDRHDGDDWEDLTGLVLGAAAGSIAGGGIGAAAPRYGSQCSFGKRVGNGLLGSLAGTLVAASLASATHADEAGWIVPVGSGVGAALAIGC
jgi:hypothetical protein